MQILTDISEAEPFRNGAVSIGNFDGVHRGHQAMLSALVEQARRLDGPALAMTFDPPPVALISPAKVPPRLSTIERKAELMSKLGVDALLVYPTNREFLSLTADDFFQQIVLQQLQAKGMVEGDNFCFGRNRSGTADVLRDYCERSGLELRIISPVTAGEKVISSTRIRELIRHGSVSEAVELLGHPYQLTGKVVSGAQRGRLIGFPTANLAEVTTLIPAPGVYAGRCEVDGRAVAAAINIGPNPTFAEQEHKIEIHLIGHDGDLYGQQLSVELFTECRKIKQFDSAESLRLQLEKDIAQIEQLFRERFGSDAR
ncbi:MAG: riboflavin biosynthesis protein RibF [Planctomyces sp.]|nr:riboflavin biosynthesis protein RibF [Planctomyces sp.]